MLILNFRSGPAESARRASFRSRWALYGRRCDGRLPAAPREASAAQTMRFKMRAIGSKHSFGPKLGDLKGRCVDSRSVAPLARRDRRRHAAIAHTEGRTNKNIGGKPATMMPAGLGVRRQTGHGRCSAPNSTMPSTTGKAESDIAWRKVKPFKKVDAARVRYLTVAEAKRLVNASDVEFRPLVQASLQTGARYGELARLQVRDFDADAGTVAVRQSKSGRARHVVLTDEGVMLFRHLTAGRPGDALILPRASGEAWGLRINHGRCAKR